MAQEPAAKKARTAPTGLASEHPRVVCRARFEGKEQAPKELHYFCLRALGELPRLLLEVSQTPYDSVMYFSSKEFKDVAAFGQMPLYKGPELGDLVVAQSGAICRHVARETGLAGSTPAEAVLHDMLFEYGKDLMANKEGLYTAGELNPRFKTLLDKGEAMLAKSGGAYLSGAKLGYGDVSVFHSLQTFEELKPGFLAPWPKLGAFAKAVAALPAVKAYLESPRRVPLTENELGSKPHAGMPGYAYTKPLSPETYAQLYDN